MAYPRQGSVIGPVLKAFYDAALADVTLTAQIGTRFYTKVPDNEVFPYVVLGAVFSAPYNTHHRPGEEISVTWSIWSVYDGTKEGEEIEASLKRLFGDSVTLDVPGWDVVCCFYEFSRVMPGNPTQIPVRFRVIAQEKEA